MAGVGSLFKKALGATGRGARAVARKATPRNVAEVGLGIPLQKSFWKERPYLAATFAAGGGAFGTNIGVQALKQPGWEKRMREEGRYEQYMWLAQRAEEDRARRLQRDMATNAARLASVAPDVYNRVLAGRTLPRGAVVIGGRPRVDMLEELAYRMASGDYKPQQETEFLSDLEAFKPQG